MSDLSGWPRRSVHGLAALAAVAGVVALGWRGRRVVVHGASMSPTLEPGDRLLLAPAWRPRTGQLVAVRDPRDPSRLLVKRVAAVDRRNQRVTVVGDNPGASTDSRVFGPVARRAVVGRVVYRYAPPGRAGRVR